MREGVAVRFQLFQCLPYLFECCLIESGAGLSYVNEVAIFVVQAEHDRAEIQPRTLRVGVSPDDAIHRLSDFDLQPLASTTLLVATAPAFRKNALQTFLSGRIEQCLALGEVVGVTQSARRLRYLCEHILALLQ